MKVKIKKSAGIVVKDDVIVVQLGKEIDLEKSLAKHLIDIGVAELIEEQPKKKIKKIDKEVE